MAAIPEECQLYEKFRGRRFVMLGINSDNDLDAARTAVTKHQIPWANWSDPFEEEDGFGPIRDRYHIYGIPRTFLLDADGLIRAMNIHGAELAERVPALLDDLEAQK